MASEEQAGTEPDIERYLNADFGLNSEAGTLLMEEIDVESQEDVLVLSALGGTTPAHLTPGMQTWYSNYVATVRAGAINAVGTLFNATSDDENSGSTFLERCLDNVENLRLKESRQILTRHKIERKAEYEELEDLKAERTKKRKDYNEKKGGSGREPKSVPLWYIPFLLVIGVAELAINFSSFSSLSYMTPAMALGSSIVIAILLAIASDMHGRLLKQSSHFFGRHRTDLDRNAGLRILAISTSALTIVLSAVSYARTQYLGDIIRTFAEIGGDSAPSWISVVGGSLTLNIAVWMTGVLISFMVHDKDPSLLEKKLYLDKLEGKINKAQNGLRKYINRDLERIGAQAEKDRKVCVNKAKSMSGDKKFEKARKAVEKIISHDAKVLALLRNYRMQLSRKLDKSITFEKPDDLDASERKDITKSDWASLEILMPYGERGGAG